MADQDTGLPVRSEADGDDERVHSKLVDYTDPDGANKQMAVTEDLAHVRNHGKDSGGTKREALLSEQGHGTTDGEYNVSTNTDPSNTGLIAHTRNVSPADAQQTERLTSVENAAGDTRALDVAMHDSAGEPIDSSNPLVVVLSSDPDGAEEHDYKEGAAIAKAATDVHTYSIADGDTLLLRKILASGSGKMKVQLEIGDGGAGEVFVTKAVTFNSTANPQADINLDVPIKILGTVNTTTVRVTKTNRDNQPQDLHSTIIGLTV